MTLEALVQTLVTRSPAPELCPKKPFDLKLNSEIAKAKCSELVRAGLYLWNDEIEKAHLIAQSIETPDGNYWHAILHRREGDFSNSKYWYRRTGPHPVFHRMAEAHPGWEALGFTDDCEASPNSMPLRKIAGDEMHFLLQHCL